MAYTRRGFAQNFWVVKTVGCDSVGMGGILQLNRDICADVRYDPGVI